MGKHTLTAPPLWYSKAVSQRDSLSLTVTDSTIIWMYYQVQTNKQQSKVYKTNNKETAGVETYTLPQ